MKTQIKILSDIDKFGHDVTVSEKKTREILCYSFIVNTFDYELTKQEKMYVNRKLLKYKKEIKYAINKLKQHKTTRQAVLQLRMTGSRPECINQIQFLIRNKRLILAVTCRSMDAKNKLFQDIQFIKRLSEMIDEELLYIKFSVGSMHTYL